jgi:hypothetical protein
MARKWWQEPSYPESAWTPADRAAARKDGWRPTASSIAERLQAQSVNMPAVPPVAGLPGGLYGNDEARAATERRRKANAILEKAGLRPQPW